ncbi:MAG: 1-(5-phosphoribosyl)-5-((5-phosphoribosylamino)methylideneamino)imidazole-4-carboxamide isomerase [Gammaproteobacteria bacterium]|nr:1-(5-phosphoribosyl)-5-((5-phosphoribosylamino)methylideneamino)imidazole-4-carboxamide isomerase [Gammaproteobacteria bacterium]MBL6819289.1 1-(5-phosphoribosyl)-5-((5-phosphoribosylamino)methylideneamino)imidazole-4-carboxamide isomerase [Gammaproteobacteria bacterium]MBL6898468.1 1-(5-phosphoribosyl)-5-((5-phosphoribosylamino)methylideneamino)imidazole-4-carboxamide isomerase [Gammaproteobacteria bacterium]
MIIYPAIDIIDGKCVRLTKGDYSQKTVYSNNLRDIAASWVEAGSKYLHIVDLDGAKAGSTVNLKNIIEIRRSFPNIFIQVGGGIRDTNSIEKYLSHGVDRIILGTKILKNKEFIYTLDKATRKSLAIDIAIKNGALAGDGWENTENEDVESFIKFLESYDIEMFVITDISKDGMMQGINKKSIDSVLKFITTRAIISGGVTSKQDIKSILNMNKEIIDGMIIGKALYENKILLSEAINECC